IAIDRAEAHPDLRRILGITREQRRPALAAEPLLRSALGLPRLEPVLSLHEVKRAGYGGCACRRRRPGAALAPCAVAVPSRNERLGDLEADRPAPAPTGQRSAHTGTR